MTKPTRRRPTAARAVRRLSRLGPLSFGGMLSPVRRSSLALALVASLALLPSDALALDLHAACAASDFGGPVRELAVYQGNLIAAGHFVMASGQTVNNIALWDDEGWKPLPSRDGGVGVLRDDGSSPRVDALLVWNDRLYVGGIFHQAGNQATAYIASWDGENWAPVGGGMDSAVLCLRPWNNVMLASGTFSLADGNSARNIAKWSGIRWLNVGEGLNAGIQAIQPMGEQVFVGGSFDKTGYGLAAHRVARWDGGGWARMGDGLRGVPPGAIVFDMTAMGEAVVIAGSFNQAGDLVANSVVLWTANEYRPFGQLTGAAESHTVAGAVTNYAGRIVAGGNFTVADGSRASRIVSWDGERWEAVGEGADDNVWVLKAVGDVLLAGGSFDNAWGMPRGGLACWDQGMPPLSIGGDEHDDEPGAGEDGTQGRTTLGIRSIEPNPVRDASRIAFSLRRGGRATLSVYDVRGRKVRVLLDENLDGGVHLARWDGRDGTGRRLPAGVYFLRLNADGLKSTRKMLLAR